MQVITSKDNETIKNIRKLKEKKYRDQECKFIVEGLKIIQEAIQENVDIDKIVICEDCETDYEQAYEDNIKYAIAKKDCIVVSEKIFQTLTSVENPQGILAVINKNSTNNNEIDFSQDLILVLDGVQDPGNLGTIIRTADSVNLKQIVITSKTADPYNPKVVRSTMGAIYRVNIIQTADLVETLKDIKKNKFKIVSTALMPESKSLYETSLNKKTIVIGNESNGVSKEVLEISDEKIVIPMLGKTESLNAAVATGVILYEYVRRLQGKQ